MRGLSESVIQRFAELMDLSIPFRAGDAKILEQMGREYPYFNEARLLEAAFHHASGPGLDRAELAACRIFAGNGWAFAQVLESRRQDAVPEPVVTQPAAEPPQTGQVDEDRKAELEAQVRRRLEAIERRQSAEEPDKISRDPNEIIERFLRDEPRIVIRKDYPAEPAEAIETTPPDDAGIVTETLARIHANQGNYRRAIEIYNKLSLKFPGKSSYFAARIKELEEKQNS